ncbi:MAG: MgtC/SapB family protein [Nanoarchaeota archaeon]
MSVIGLNEMLLRLFLAVLFGGAVGFEREHEHMAAGLRTHILVCLGSTLGILIALTTFPDPDSAAKIAQGLITGIGFLGAGTIIHFGGHVRGLTTAASLWAVCLIGIAIGFGYYFGAMVTTLAVTLLLLLHEWKYFKKSS